jgi:hypothetical protein
MPGMYRQMRRGFNRRPMNYTKHCFETKVSIAANSLLSDFIYQAPIGDEVEDDLVDTLDRGQIVKAGDKIFSVDIECAFRAATEGAEGFVEWAVLKLTGGDFSSLTAETTDINSSGLAKDLIGRYAGHVLRTGIVGLGVSSGGRLHFRLKIPRKYRRAEANGGALLFVMYNHNAAAIDSIRKYIYKAYS